MDCLNGSFSLSAQVPVEGNAGVNAEFDTEPEAHDDIDHSYSVDLDLIAREHLICQPHESQKVETD